MGPVWREPGNLLMCSVFVRVRFGTAKASKDVGVSTGALWLYLGKGSVCAGSVRKVGSVEGLWV